MQGRQENFWATGQKKLSPPPPILQITIPKLSPPRCVISKEAVQQKLFICHGPERLPGWPPPPSQWACLYVPPCSGFWLFKNLTKIQKYIFFQIKLKEFEDTKGIVRICKSKKNRLCNGQKNNYIQSTTQKTNDRTTRTPLKIEGELGCSGMVSTSCSTSGTCRVTLVKNPLISHEWWKDREVLMISGTYPWSIVPHIP